MLLQRSRSKYWFWIWDGWEGGGGGETKGVDVRVPGLALGGRLGGRLVCHIVGCIGEWNICSKESKIEGVG